MQIIRNKEVSIADRLAALVTRMSWMNMLQVEVLAMTIKLRHAQERTNLMRRAFIRERMHPTLIAGSEVDAILGSISDP